MDNRNCIYLWIIEIAFTNLTDYLMQDFNDVVQKLPNLHLTSATKTIFEKLQSCLAIITYSIIKYSKSEDRQLMQKPA